MKLNRKNLFLASTATITLTLSTPSLHAQDGTWAVDADGNWTDATNWTGNITANGTDFTATLNNITANRTITLDANQTVGNITAADTTHNFTIAGASTLTLAVTTGTPTITVPTGARVLTIQSVIDGSLGLSKIGAGALILSGNNTYTGETTLSTPSGTSVIATLTVSDNNALGSTTGGTTIIGSNTTGNGNTLVLSNGITVTGETLTLDSGGNATTTGYRSAMTLAGNGTALWDGDVVVTGNATQQIAMLSNGAASILTVGGSSADTITLNRPLALRGGAGTGIINSSITGVGILGKSDGGTWVLAGPSNYSGNTTVGTGALVYRNLGTKSASSTHIFTSTSTLGLGVGGAGFFSSTDVDNAFAGNMTGNLSNVTVTTAVSVGIDTTAGDFGYTVPGSPTRGLGKLGANTLTLSGANTYTGATTINQGTLRINDAAAIPTGSGKGNVVFDSAANNAVLDINGFDATINGLSQATVSTTSLVVNNATGTNKTLTVGNNNASSTFNGTIADNTSGTGTLALTKIGTGNLVLGGNNSYSGVTTADGSLLTAAATMLTVSSNTALGSTAGGTTLIGGSSPGDGPRITLSEGVTVTGETLTISTGVAGFRSALTTSGNATWAGNVVIASNTGFGQIIAAANTTLTIGTSAANTFTLNGPETIRGAGNTTINSTISGNATLQKIDAGTLTLTAANIHTGNTSLATATPGVLLLANSLALQNSTLDITGTVGSGGVRFDSSVGSNAFTLGGLSGNATTGTPRIIALQNTANTSVALTVGGNNQSTTFAGDLTAGGSLTKIGNGTLSLTGNNTYSGDTTVSDGILSFSPATAPDPLNANPNNDASTVTIATTGATLDLNFTGTDNVDKLFSGATQQPSGNYSSSSVPDGASISTSKFTGNGTLTVGPVPAGPPFTTWPGGNSTNFYADANGDGVSNGMTWLLGGANTTSNGLALLPAPVVSGGNMTLNFKTPNTTTAPARLLFEYSTNLVIWSTPVEITAANGTFANGNFTVAPGGNGTNNVSLIVNGNASLGEASSSADSIPRKTDSFKMAGSLPRQGPLPGRALPGRDFFPKGPANEP